MGCYIPSTNNSIYAGLEGQFGHVAAQKEMLPAVRLQVRHERERLRRADKTGTRTLQPAPAGARRITSYALRTYLAGWGEGTLPVYHPLVLGLMGGSVTSASPKQITETNGLVVTFSQPHGLAPGQALSAGREIRFVTASPTSDTVQVNFPFSPGSLDEMNRSITYAPGDSLPTVSLFDFWRPESAVQRIVRGAAVDRMDVRLNGDFHTFDFSGPAVDLIDSESFVAGEGGLPVFPARPASNGPLSVVPGNLGQFWAGTGQQRLFSVIGATLTIRNGIMMRATEFGSLLPRCMSAGVREATLDFSLYAEDRAELRALYEAARTGSPVPVMLQLGDTPEEMFAVYMKSVMLQTPEFDDSEPRLVWNFRASLAEGWIDDEVYLAFA